MKPLRVDTRISSTYDSLTALQLQTDLLSNVRNDNCVVSFARQDILHPILRRPMECATFCIVPNSNGRSLPDIPSMITYHDGSCQFSWACRLMESSAQRPSECVGARVPPAPMSAGCDEWTQPRRFRCRPHWCFSMR